MPLFNKKRKGTYDPNLPPALPPFKTLSEPVKCDRCARPAYTKVDLPDVYRGYLCDDCFEILPYPYNGHGKNQTSEESAAGAGNDNTDGTAEEAEKLFKEGKRYFCGDGVDKDREKALELFTEAAGAGHAEAQYNVGICHMRGRYGKALDLKQAVYWLEKAALQGCADAAHDLGKLYISTVTEPYYFNDYKKAVKWLTQAVDAGHAEAMNDLGKCYAEGKGVEQNYKKAKYLWTEAAGKGSALAKENLQTLKRVKK